MKRSVNSVAFETGAASARGLLYVAAARDRRVWRAFGTGILLIRFLMLPTIRQEAELAAPAEGPTTGRAR